MARVDVVMPKMGESVMEGTVLEWKKKVGDVIELDETLLEISTDKVDSEVPAPSAGKLVEILVQEGDTVDVGVPIAIIDSDVNAEVSSGDAPAEAPEAPVEEVSAPATAPEASAQPAENGSAPAPSGGGGARVNVVMPKMGESVMEGTVLTWAKKVGDEVELDETLLEISTDKVDSEVPSPSAGVLVEILVAEGDTVDVGTPIAVIASGEAAAAVPTAPAPASQPALAPVATQSAAPSGDGAAMEVVATPAGGGGPIQRRGADGRFYSPLVRSIAETEGLSMGDLEAIAGTGAEGRVTKGDVMAYIANRGSQPAARPAPSAAPAPAARPTSAPVVASQGGERVEIVEMDRMRQLISEHMTRSKATSAHVTSFTEIDMSGVVAHREKHKAEFQAREGTKLTYTPYFLFAAIEPMRAHPLMNSSVEGTRIMVKKDFHIGIAVAIGSKGLLVPVVRNAGQQNLTGLAHSVADLANRARNKQLLPDELQGGTITITNVGSLGSLMGTPIINQPQVAILSPGAIVKRPVVMEDPTLGDVIAIRHMMYVSLSYDHRIIDGAMAASFLAAYRESLEAIGPETALF